MMKKKDSARYNSKTRYSYYHPNDYYSVLSIEGGEHNLIWSREETIFIYNICSANKWLSMYYAKTFVANFCKESQLRVEKIFEACWKRVHSSFKMALEKFEQVTGKKHLRSNDSSWEECAEHMDVMMNMTWSSENRYYWHEIKELWFNEYNKDSVLFDAAEFDYQYDLNYEMVGQREEKQKTAALRFYADMKKSCSIMRETEEIILYGAAMDRELSYIHRGGTKWAGFGDAHLKLRTWTSIKEQYDLAWRNAVKRYPSKFAMTDYRIRTPKELRNHYILIWIRSYYHLEGKTMNELDHEWFSVLNKDGALISRSESLASKPDDRYAANNMVPKPNDTLGIPEEVAALLLSDWKDLEKLKQAETQLKAPAPFPPLKGCPTSTIKDSCFAFNPVEQQETNKSNKRARVSNWTREEEIILFGVLLIRADSLTGSEGEVEPKEELEFIKSAFDIASQKFYELNGSQEQKRTCVSRSSQSLSKRIQILHKHAPRHSPYQNYLRDMWTNVYNKDSRLLAADYFNKVLTPAHETASKSYMNDLSFFELQVADQNLENSEICSLTEQDLDSFCDGFDDVFFNFDDDSNEVTDVLSVSTQDPETPVPPGQHNSKVKTETKKSTRKSSRAVKSSSTSDEIKVKLPKFIETELKKMPGSGEYDSVECMIMLFYVYSFFDHPDVYSKVRECMQNKRSRASIRHKLTKVIHKYTGHKGSVLQKKEESEGMKRIINLEFWDMIHKAEEFGEGSMLSFAKRLRTFAMKQNMLPEDK